MRNGDWVRFTIDGQQRKARIVGHDSGGYVKVKDPREMFYRVLDRVEHHVVPLPREQKNRGRAGRRRKGFTPRIDPE